MLVLFGITSPSPYISEREITDDLPVDIIGECIVEAVNSAWQNGHDPAIEPFVVMVVFK